MVERSEISFPESRNDEEGNAMYWCTEIDPHIKVLLSSGYGIDDQAVQILALDCDGFIQKPFNMEDLSKSTRAILDKDNGEEARP